MAGHWLRADPERDRTARQLLAQSRFIDQFSLDVFLLLFTILVLGDANSHPSNHPFGGMFPVGCVSSFRDRVTGWFSSRRFSRRGRRSNPRADELPRLRLAAALPLQRAVALTPRLGVPGATTRLES